MTPLQIEILLHYYTRQSDYRSGDFDAPAVEDAMMEFESSGMLERNEAAKPVRIFRLSERGHVYIDALCALPLPVQKWSMP